MLRNYLTTAFRQLRRNKLHAGINVLGLALGMACSALILLYVRHELSYDGFHENGDRIYRVVLDHHRPEADRTTPSVPPPLSDLLSEAYSGVESFAHLYMEDDEVPVRAGDQVFFETGMALADPGLFDIFTFPVVAQAHSTPLPGPGSVVITSSVARRYFGKGMPALGKTVQIGGGDFEITCVIADIPSNSHFRFDLVVFEEEYGSSDNWWNSFSAGYSYLLLEKGLSPSVFLDRVPLFTADNSGLDAGNSLRVELQPLSDIYLNAQAEDTQGSYFPYADLLILSTLAGFILLIACINFISLSTARSIHRNKEVGVRKTLGASRRQLVRQFTGESLLVTLIAMLVAVSLVELCFPAFTGLLGKHFAFSFVQDWHMLLVFAALSVPLGLAVGLLPSFLLSRIEASAVLKKSLGAGSSFLLRRGLIVSQFALACLLLGGTLVVDRHLSYMLGADLGFDRELQVFLPLSYSNIGDADEALRSELQQHQAIRRVALSTTPPVSGGYWNGWEAYPVNDPGNRFGIKVNSVDLNYLDQFRMEVVAGTGLTRAMSDLRDAEFVVNETFARERGFASPQEAIGRRYVLSVNGLTGTVVSVARDFHVASLHERIRPTLLVSYPMMYYGINVKIADNREREALAFLEEVWKRLVPVRPFQYSFLDDEIASLYRDEEHTRLMIATASGMALFVTCIGLFGLTSYTAERRRQEIGVRKAIGASVEHIVFLLSKDYLVYVGVANAVALPALYYFADSWLQNFAYHEGLGVTVVVQMVALTALVALLTVSFQSTRAARANPVAALRDE